MIIEYELEKSQEDIMRKIIRNSFEAKQGWFGLSDRKTDSFDPLLLIGEKSGRKNLVERTRRSWKELSPYNQERIAYAHGDSAYNHRLISALTNAIGFGGN